MTLRDINEAQTDVNRQLDHEGVLSLFICFLQHMGGGGADGG